MTNSVFKLIHFLGFIIAGLIPSAVVAADVDLVKILTDSDVASDHYLPDFSYAGYNHGVGDIPILSGKTIDVTDYGVVPDDDEDDSKSLQDALQAAHEVRGPVILKFPKGKIIISEILKITRSDIVLRGYGSGLDGTILHFPRPLQMIDQSDALNELRTYLKKYDKKQREPKRNIDKLFSEYSWSGGFIWIQKDGTRPAAYLEENDPKIVVLADALNGKAGTQNLTVNQGGKLSVGDVVELQWFNRQGEEGALIKEMYGNTSVKIGSHHWTFKDRPLVRQKTEILAVEGTQITISDPLLHNISSAVPAQLAQWQHLENVGIEDLRITFPESPSFGHHMERGYNGIYMTSVFDGWVRNVNFHNSDASILTYNSANLTISEIETTGNRRAHYSVHAGNVHNVLVQNLRVNNPSVHALSLNTQSTKCVFQNAVVTKTPVLDQHAGANHQNLFDNVTVYVPALRDKSGPYFPIWDGSGAGYWQPGHGRFNTTWNLKVDVISGAYRDETVTLRGLAEGPDARLIGISGNRKFDIDYYPEPYLEKINDRVEEIPSLYQYQLQKRLQK